MPRSRRLAAPIAALLAIAPMLFVTLSLTGCEGERGGMTAEPETAEETSPDDLEM